MLRLCKGNYTYCLSYNKMFDLFNILAYDYYEKLRTKTERNRACLKKILSRLSKIKRWIEKTSSNIAVSRCLV